MPGYNVLFLCTGNSARSIMAECILNRLGGERFRGFSAGSQPKGEVHPMTLRLLRQLGHPTEGLRSKSWDEFAGPEAPPLDLVITVCGNAADEVCPVWPGGPISAHWGVPDPAACDGPPDEQLRVFRGVYAELERRIRSFTSLPIAALDKPGLKARLDEIGEAKADTDSAA